VPTVRKAEDPVSGNDQGQGEAKRISMTQPVRGSQLSQFPSNSTDSLLQQTQPPIQTSPTMNKISVPNRLHTQTKLQQPNSSASQIAKFSSLNTVEMEDLDWNEALFQCDQLRESMSHQSFPQGPSNPNAPSLSFLQKDTPKLEQRSYDEAAEDEGHISGKLVDLGKNKLVTISMFNGKALIHLREYYRDQDDGLRKPTKKGIALAIDQWNELCSHIPLINSAIEQFDGHTSKRTSTHRDMFEQSTPSKKQYFRRDTTASTNVGPRNTNNGYPYLQKNERLTQDSITSKPRQNSRTPSTNENSNSYSNRNNGNGNRASFPFHVANDID
jgi:hypothetical protein